MVELIASVNANQISKQSSQDLVKSQASLATLNQLVAQYNQLYKSYLQQVESEASKKDVRKYPYNINNLNEVNNTLTPDKAFPSNGTETECFKSCLDMKDCAYALYSNSGCGIDCNPNKCLLYGANAEGIVPVNEVSNKLSPCPNSDETDAWCESFNRPIKNSIIPVFVVRVGGTDWRTLAMQMPKTRVDATDVPFTVDLTTNVQSWGPDPQFYDVNYAPENEVSLQFRFFAEYWLNVYGLTSGSTTVITREGVIGEFGFAKLSSSQVNAQCNWQNTNQCIFKDYTMRNDACSVQGSNNPSYSVSGLASYDTSGITGWLQELYNRNFGDNPAKGEAANVYQYWNKCKSVPGYEFLNNLNFANPNPGQSSDESGTSYVGTFNGQTMFWNSNNPSSGGTAAGLKTAAVLASATYDSDNFKYNYSAYEKPFWKVDENVNAMKDQVPPQLAGTSIPSWQFLGMKNSAEECQRAADDDSAHVYSMATYYNASYNNPNNGNSVFAGACYGHVAGAPMSTVSSYKEDGVQTMTPSGGYTKLGGKSGIYILKKMYHLNQQIVALTEELKLKMPSSGSGTKEGYTNRNGNGNEDYSVSELVQQLEVDADNLTKEIQKHTDLESDEMNTNNMLLYSRVKLAVAVVLGLFLAYLAYRFLTAEELTTTIQNQISSASGTRPTGLDGFDDN